MPARQSSAVWEGTLKDGKGTMKLGSGAYEGAYSFASRFESGKGTNPEELIAAAHAGCFPMALSAALSRAGFTPKKIATTATVPNPVARCCPRRIAGHDKTRMAARLDEPEERLAARLVGVSFRRQPLENSGGRRVGMHR